MKIAVAADDKINVAEHFGGSSLTIVATVKDGEVVKKRRDLSLAMMNLLSGNIIPKLMKKGDMVLAQRLKKDTK